jgi:hypothetical protein
MLSAFCSGSIDCEAGVLGVQGVFTSGVNTFRGHKPLSINGLRWKKLRCSGV